MQNATFYAGMPVGWQQGSSNTLRSRLVLLTLPIIVIAISAGSLYVLQLSSQRGIVLGYPIPQVQITTTYSSPVRLNDSVQFSAESSGRDLTYQWDFGDQTGATGPSVSHTFQSSGNFTVTVTVTDAVHRTSNASTTVTVMPPPPLASFTWTPGSYYSSSISLDASGSSADPSTSITNYHWDFGDGTTDDTQSSQEYHNYSSSGTYTVALTVTDGTGQQSQAYSLQVSV